MTDAPNVPAKTRALIGGGNVMAIVPQTFEETFRVARAVYMGGLAPAALVAKLEGDAAISAVTVAIMSGAELGLQPMVALRSFTVINGRPALYGDGLINVVRQSGKVAYLRTGCDVRDGQMIGWCEAKRNDTEEDKRVEFSQADAIRAGLWSDQPTVEKFWNGVSKGMKPNDSPWFRYPQRMLAWRAAGYCLRELFGDVLGGIRDEFEAREIADAEMIDVTPALTPPSPPEPPEVANAQTPADQAGDTNDDDSGPIFDPDKFMADLEKDLAAALDADSIEEAWDQADVERTLVGDDARLTRAFDLKAKRQEAVEPNMFPGDRP